MRFKALFTFALFQLLAIKTSRGQPEVAPWSNTGVSVSMVN